MDQKNSENPYHNFAFFFFTMGFSSEAFLFELQEAWSPWSTASSTISGSSDLSLSYCSSLNSYLGISHNRSSFFCLLSLASFSRSACWFIQFFNLQKSKVRVCQTINKKNLPLFFVYVSQTSSAEISTSFPVRCFFNLCANGPEHRSKTAFTSTNPWNYIYLAIFKVTEITYKLSVGQ